MDIIGKLLIKTHIKVNFSLLVLLIGLFPITTLTDVSNTPTVQAITYDEPIDSNNVTISISKNATGISQYSRLEFGVNLTNSLSESAHNINIIANQTSSYISLSPLTDPAINIPELTPGETTNLKFVAKIIGEVTNPAVDLLLVIDASGSMGDEITSVKEKITNITDNLPKEIPQLRIGIIIYGWTEFAENPLSHTGNLLPFTTDFEAVKDYINSLYAAGSKEPWGDALYLANSLEWRENSQKLIIMVGDEDCDPGNIVGNEEGGTVYNGSQLVNEVQNLKDKGVIINTVVSNNPDDNVEEQFGWISNFTGGKSVSLPEMQSEGTDLPDLIEEWTLELGREFSQDFNLEITWKDGLGISYRNSAIETFWLDLAYPSVVVSENVKTTGLNQYSVEILAIVSDFSAISFVNLYYSVTGSTGVIPMNLLPNQTLYLAEIENLRSGDNLSYFIESSDVLKNVGKTKNYWMLVETPKLVIGQEMMIWAESSDQIFSEIAFTEDTMHYLILSGPKETTSLLVSIIYPGTTNQLHLGSEYSQNVTTNKWRKFFPIEFISGSHFLNITIPEDLGNFSFSYVWLTLENMGNTTDDHFTGEMTDKIRVGGLKWYGEKGFYFNMFLESQTPLVTLGEQTPLVTLGEIYTTNWEFLGPFSAVSSYNITENTTYYILIWATLREGEYIVSVDSQMFVIDDPYYYPADYAQSGAIGFTVYIIFLALVGFALTRKLSRKKKR
ncbi:MAG: vWA domain-containing protein [Candidatus Hodarchaeales archaeon]